MVARCFCLVANHSSAQLNRHKQIVAGQRDELSEYQQMVYAPYRLPDLCGWAELPLAITWRLLPRKGTVLLAADLGCVCSDATHAWVHEMKVGQHTVVSAHCTVCSA